MQYPGSCDKLRKHAGSTVTLIKREANVTLSRAVDVTVMFL